MLIRKLIKLQKRAGHLNISFVGPNNSWTTSWIRHFKFYLFQRKIFLKKYFLYFLIFGTIENNDSLIFGLTKKLFYFLKIVFVFKFRKPFFEFELLIFKMCKPPPKVIGHFLWSLIFHTSHFCGPSFSIQAKRRIIFLRIFFFFFSWKGDFVRTIFLWKTFYVEKY
jgi:hypothetical protein